MGMHVRVCVGVVCMRWWWWWWWGMRVQVCTRGQRKTENQMHQLGFRCALSNSGVGQWREMLGWFGQGGGGGGGCTFECAPGGEAGAKRNQKPSSPAQFWVCPVKQLCRAMEGGGGVVWARWWWWCACTVKRTQGGRARAKKKPENQAIMAWFWVDPGCGLGSVVLQGPMLL